VGTGPGDPELLTLKAVRAIEAADLVLYDRLVSNDVLDLVGEGARLLYVGKTAGYHSRTQEEIHELLLSFAEAGANVVRLKGGDPLVIHCSCNATYLGPGNLAVHARASTTSVAIVYAFRD
jgi:uroporphyrin-III C-methyltransferase